MFRDAILRNICERKNSVWGLNLIFHAKLAKILKDRKVCFAILFKILPTFVWNKTLNMQIKTSYHYIIAGIMMLLWCDLHAQRDEYFREKVVRNDNLTYRDNIQTVLLYKAGFELSPPIIQLGTADKLVLSFDDLDAEHKSFKYTLIHCDAYWNVSTLQQMEYLDGFFEDRIDDYKYSFNTTVPFVNYVLVFPTEYLRLKKSGNYIIKVYLGPDTDENVVLTRRFMVSDPKVNFTGNIGNTVDLHLRYTHQQVNFKLTPDNYQLTETHRDLHVFIQQNGRWDNMMQNIQPRLISGGVYDFSQMPGLAFEGGNEFRYFDMKTLQYNTDRMKSLQYTTEGYQVILQTDMPRAYSNFRSEEDINGRRLISVNHAQDSYTEGDYAWVHFLLPYQEPLDNGNLYVFGALSDWQFRPENLMRYNYELKAYEAKIFLKQGYYNYIYAFLENNKNTGDITLIEGSFWETENEYTILIYHRRQGDVYDQLVGVGYLNSND